MSICCCIRVHAIIIFYFLTTASCHKPASTKTHIVIQLTCVVLEMQRGGSPPHPRWLMYPIRKTRHGGGSGTPGDSPAPTLAQGLPHLGTHQPYHVLQVHPTWGLTHSTMGPRSAPRWGTHQRIPSTSRSAEDPKGHMVPSTCNILTLAATMSHT